MPFLASTRALLALPLLAVGLTIAGCDSNDDDDEPRTFSVTVANVSTPGTVDTDRAMGTVPLSPPAYAVFSGDDPMFTLGGRANLGTERIAEDGFPDEMVALLGRASNVTASGAAPSPGGADMGPALFAALMGLPAESVTFTVTAVPGQKLQMETMFVQSNDWFISFRDGGLDLFGDEFDDSDRDVDVTGRLAVYDAGTEEDTAPGTGPNQKPVQAPMATNVGPADDNPNIRLASTSGFTVPDLSRVARVTVRRTR